MNRVLPCARTAAPALAARVAITLLSLIGFHPGVVAADASFVFEDLGEPVRIRALGMEAVTAGPGGPVAWGTYEAPEGNALVGVRLDGGDVVRIGLARFGRSHIQFTRAADGNLWIYAGSPGHFLKYDAVAGKLTDLGVPASPASYWLGSAVGPDGRFYVGTYPNACLVCCDPATGRIASLGRLSDDKRQCYLLHPAVGDDNAIYCPVGLHHRELWAVEAGTGAKKQILPESMTAAQGVPQVWRSGDGRIYGRSGDATFLCHPDRIEIGKAQPPQPRPRPRPTAPDGRIVGHIDDRGRLALTDPKTKRPAFLQTRYEGAPLAIFSVSCERDGRIYGGTFSPAISFSYDPRTGMLADLGPIAADKVQVYDTLNHPSGLFLSSYMPASVDFLDPALPVKRPANPRHIVSVAGQERPVQLALGPDGMIYSGTFPSKGRLGGALVRVNPMDFSCRVWTNVIENQSISSVAAAPALGGVLCASSIQGGSSAIPVEKEACVFLWDCAREAVTFRARPVPGATHYGTLVPAAGGVFYGTAGARYFAFDPARRETVFAGDLPVKSPRFPELSDAPAGPRGLIYGVGDDAVFAIDPADHSARIVARHPTLARAMGFFATPEGTLYYGSGSRLMRARAGP